MIKLKKEANEKNNWNIPEHIWYQILKNQDDIEGLRVDRDILLDQINKK